MGADEIDFAHCVNSVQTQKMMDYCELLAELDLNFAVLSHKLYGNANIQRYLMHKRNNCVGLGHICLMAGVCVLPILCVVAQAI